GIRRLQPRVPRGDRDGHLRDAPASPLARVRRRRARAAPDDRRQDGRTARARGDGRARRLHPLFAARGGDAVIEHPGDDRVFVETAARLHFGVLDLRGTLGRWFGGIGAAAPAPSLLVSAARAAALEVDGEDADRAAGFARAFLTHHRVDGGARITVHRALPAHAGLGSGTQLGLAVARALAELHATSTAAADLAVAGGRARRSAIGTWTFAGGGLVVEGGRQAGGDHVAPLIARLPFPPSWHVVVAVPRRLPGISGADEDAAFERLPRPDDGEAERVAHLVLLGLLPALA